MDPNTECRDAEMENSYPDMENAYAGRDHPYPALDNYDPGTNCPQGHSAHCLCDTCFPHTISQPNAAITTRVRQTSVFHRISALVPQADTK